ncbi:putative tricarboxylic transport membrane protein [Oscillibacter sp. PC13]|uniref:tripartite tricarboxylate transporter permease n=1 Tax=Oscillibacter sp. PC13 TaxID=1855299 RepID=UPI0008F33D3C|nr:tripartite tricarboxylate transporter permease [Oscillibacter sp. PC13]SFP37396.1 putative tricarboxylic transport membrane protein [Oscillibacter sp. PC13]
MLDNITNALPNVFTLANLVYANLGLFFGIIIGALPGLTATMGVVLMLPLTFALDPVPSIVLLLGVYFGGIYGGSITAILLNTPGTPASAATAWDGNPLARQGKAGKALDMALMASFAGGIISALCLLFFAPTIASYALKFGAPDMFSLCLFGLTIIVSMCSKDLVKGLSMAGLGLLLASIGLDPVGGIERMTFGIRGFTGGIDLVTALIGLFAIGEILFKVLRIDEKDDMVTDKISGACNRHELRQCLPTIGIGSLIGVVIGAIPGTGSVIASFLSYDTAKRRSKHPEEFGKGSLEGIAASESANNGVTGAALIPLLTLGIPGDTVTAVMLGALMMQNLTPGPMLFSTHGNLVYAMILSAFLVNIFMLLQGKLLIKPFSNVTKIPMRLMVPILTVLCLTGTFALRNTMFDVRVMLFFGIISFFAMKNGYPTTPMVLAFVLGPTAEKFLRKALMLSKGDWSIFLTKPISLVFLILAVLSLVLALRKNKNFEKLRED